MATITIDLDEISSKDLIEEVMMRVSNKRFYKSFESDLRSELKKLPNKQTFYANNWTDRIDEYLREKCQSLAGIMEVEEQLGIIKRMEVSHG